MIKTDSFETDNLKGLKISRLEKNKYISSKNILKPVSIIIELHPGLQIIFTKSVLRVFSKEQLFSGVRRKFS